MLRQYAKVFRKVALVFDICLIISVFFTVYFLSGSFKEAAPFKLYFGSAVAIALIWVYLLSRFGVYSFLRTLETSEILYIVFKSAFFSLIICAGLMYLLKTEQLERQFVALTFITATAALVLEKIAVIRTLHYYRRMGYNYRNILIVGTNHRAEHFARIVNNRSEWGLRIIGFIEEDGSRVGQDFCGAKITGSFKDLAHIIHHQVVDEVVFIVPRSWLDKIQGMLYLCETEGIRVSIAVDFFEFKFAKARQAELEGFPLVTFETTPNKIWHLAFKRLLDIAVSLVGLIALSWLFLIISLLIKLTSPGPVFFRQRRCTLNGRKFTLYKFRTMVKDAEKQLEGLRSLNEMQGPVFKLSSDPRVNSFGKFLRKFSLDELPQLWNVFIGDMSLVGPRPPIPQEVEQYEPWQRRRLSMRPGITCIWQTNGRNKITDFNEWMKLDLEYIDHWSLWLDLKLILKTVPAVAFGIGAK